MGQGSLETVLEGLNRAKRDLGDVIYRNIDQKYRKQLVELKTTELAVQDLDKYFKVSLQMFHTKSLPSKLRLAITKRVPVPILNFQLT